MPAIALLDRVGSSRLSSRLRQAGANLVLPKDEAPGLAMGLGGVGVTLQDLAMLYAGLPRLGTTKPLREIIDGKTDDREPMRLMDQVAAWQVAQRPARHAAAGERRRAAASPSRPAPATAIATPGRSASTAA